MATFAVTCITVVLVLLMARVVQLQIRPSPL